MMKHLLCKSEILPETRPEIPRGCYQMGTCPVENMGDHVLLFSQTTAGEIIYISSSAEKILGIPREAVCGNSWIDLLQWTPFSARLLENIFGTIFCGLNERPVELSFFHSDGTERILELAVQPVFDEAGILIRIDGIAIDTTRRKHFRDLGKNSANPQQILFLSHFRNEIRTLLNCNAAVAEMVRAEPNLPEPVKESLDVIIRSIDEMKNTMDDFYSLKEKSA